MARSLSLVCACLSAGCATPTSLLVARCPPPIALGLDIDGYPTPRWLDATRDRVDTGGLATIARTAKPLTAEESRWRALVTAEADAWCLELARLDEPFRQLVVPPRQPTILLGNQGGGDGFTHGPDDVAIDLGELSRLYADKTPEVGRSMLRRLLAHEYTHLLLHRWLDATGWSDPAVLEDPFLRALRTLFNEGIANFRSIENERWIAAGGELSRRSRETLAELQPVMLERLQRLSAHPSADEAARLSRNISQGPLERKWGAMPIALWFAAATRGDPTRMAEWIEAKPDGILALAVQLGDPQYREAFRRLLEEARARRGSR